MDNFVAIPFGSVAVEYADKARSLPTDFLSSYNLGVMVRNCMLRVTSSKMLEPNEHVRTITMRNRKSQWKRKKRESRDRKWRFFNESTFGELEGAPVRSLILQFLAVGASCGQGAMNDNNCALPTMGDITFRVIFCY
jgi:hypothetical protein